MDKVYQGLAVKYYESKFFYERLQVLDEEIQTESYQDAYTLMEEKLDDIHERWEEEVYEKSRK